MRGQSPKKRQLLKRLPSWFRVDAYRTAANLDAFGWYVQTSVRQVCYFQLRDMREPHRIVPEWDSPVQQALASLRKSPICDPACSPFKDPPLSFCREFKPSQVPVVRSMTLEDLRRLGDCAERKSLDEVSVALAEKTAGDNSAFDRLFDREWGEALLDYEWFGQGYVPVMIDLKFPNRVLKRQFEKHLQKLRRGPTAKSSQARKKTPNLNDWAKIGLLPCMDLLLWAEEEALRMPDSLIARALGTSENVGEENVRKTVRPLAMKILNPDRNTVLDERLRALAYAQRSLIE